MVHTGPPLLPSGIDHWVNAKKAMERCKEGDGVISLALAKDYTTSRIKSRLQQGNNLEGMPKIIQVSRTVEQFAGPMQNENVRCLFKKQEKGAIKGT